MVLDKHRKIIVSELAKVLKQRGTINVSNAAVLKDFENMKKG